MHHLLRRAQSLARLGLAMLMLAGPGSGVAPFTRDAVRAVAPLASRALVAGAGAAALLLATDHPRPAHASAGYSSTILADSPLAYYRLGETSGTTAHDSSGNHLDATIAGGATLGVEGAIYQDSDPAMQLDGKSGQVDLPSGFANFPSGMTVEAWIAPTSAGSWERVIDLGNGAASDNILFARNNGSNDLTFQVYSGGTAGAQVTAHNVLVNTVWQYVAATMDGSGNVTIYDDGVAVATGTTSVPRNLTRTSNFIGRSN